MPHSFIMLREEKARFHDSELYVAYWFLRRACKDFLTRCPQDSAAQRFDATLDRIWPFVGTGVALLEVEKLFIEDLRPESFLQVITSAENDVRRFGGAIPLKFLQENLGEPGISWLKDWPTAELLRIFEILRDFVSRGSAQ